MIKDAAGGGIALSTTITNNNDRPQPFVALIEVRDNSGVTVFLAFRSGTLHPLLSSNVGVVWQPEHEGKFEIRTFAITSISGDAELLSLPAVSDITINSAT